MKKGFLILLTYSLPSAAPLISDATLFRHEGLVLRTACRFTWRLGVVSSKGDQVALHPIQHVCGARLLERIMACRADVLFRRDGNASGTIRAAGLLHSEYLGNMKS